MLADDQTLLGKHRITPNSPSPGPLPVNSTPAPTNAIDADTWQPTRYLAFARPSTTGEFTDFTARYGALQEEDKLKLIERMMEYFNNKAAAEKEADSALTIMELTHMRDIPAIALSSGQTRRMRIGIALMTRPELLILEDPMAGLDKTSRVVVSDLLSDLNATQDNPRVVLVLRDKGDETLADWVTNVCEVREGKVWIGTREEYDARQKREKIRAQKAAEDDKVDEGNTSTSEPPIVLLQNVNVSYGEGTRKVLQDVNWSIRPGERWHLQGANGVSSLARNVADM